MYVDSSINFLITDCNRLIPPGLKKRIMKSKHGLAYNYLHKHVYVSLSLVWVKAYP